MSTKNNEWYQVVRISVKISDGGRGLTQEQIDKLCRRFEKIAKGRAQDRDVSAEC